MSNDVLSVDPSDVKKIVAYYRVSTKKQGKRQKKLTKEQVLGLGLEAQKKAVQEFAARRKAPVIAEYVEIETGTRKRERPKLAEAIGHARLQKATLVIAKLDRLSRNVAFVSALLESGVHFVCVDNPTANHLTIHILAAIAQNEAEAISRRTREALAVLRREGVQLGSNRPGHWEGREHKRGWRQGAKASAAIRTERAKAAYAFLIPKMKEMVEAATLEHERRKALASDRMAQIREEYAPRIANAKDRKDEKARKALIAEMRQAQFKVREEYAYPIYEKVAEQLNAMSISTMTGSPFNAPTVYRILQRDAGHKPRKRMDDKKQLAATA